MPCAILTGLASKILTVKPGLGALTFHPCQEASFIRFDTPSFSLSAIIGITIAALAAQSTPPPRQRQDCSAAVYREFDFWVGTWTVTAQGKPAGTNRIEVDLNGCVLVEHWTAASGGRGTSLNFYDRASKAWHQSWMDQSGGALRLKGALTNGRMVLQSDPHPGSDGGSAIQRVTWTPEPDGTVRQLWESTSDAGKTWTTVFDGRYTRAK